MPGSVVAVFAQESWLWEAVSPGLSAEERDCCDWGRQCPRDVASRRGDAIMWRWTLSQLLLLLRCAWGSWDKKEMLCVLKGCMYSTSRGAQLPLYSLYLQYVPAVEGLKAGAKICLLAHGCSSPKGISASLLQLCYTWPTILLQFFGWAEQTYCRYNNFFITELRGKLTKPIAAS